jgi:hypothetical protein
MQLPLRHKLGSDLEVTSCSRQERFRKVNCEVCASGKSARVHVRAHSAKTSVSEAASRNLSHEAEDKGCVRIKIRLRGFTLPVGASSDCWAVLRGFSLLAGVF